MCGIRIRTDRQIFRAVGVMVTTRCRFNKQYSIRTRSHLIIILYIFNPTTMSMGISYSTAKWLVGHQALLISLKYADLLARRQQPSSSTSQPSNMAYSPLPTCWTSIMRTYLSGAQCLNSSAASSSPSSCSSLHGSTVYTSLIPRHQLSAPNWIKLVGPD